MAEAAYTAKDITVLEGLEPVRLRPGMYIGSTGSRGLHHLVYEVVDNSVDEALAGRADHDRGDHPSGQLGHGHRQRLGHPGRRHARAGPARRDGRADEAARRRQVRRRGLQGLRRPPRRRRLGRERALGVAPRRGAARRQDLPPGVRPRRADDRARGRSAPPTETGTTITFLPDGEIFDELEWSAETLVQRLRETAFLTKGLRIVLIDEREGEEQHEFHYEGGIRDFVAYVNEAKDPVHKHIVYFEGDNGDGPGRGRDAVEHLLRRVGLLVREQHQHHTRAARTSPASRRALTRTLNDYAARKGLLKEKEDNLEGEDVREGLAAVISVKLRDPQFEGQTKTKLGNAVGARSRRADGQPRARRVPRGEPDRGEADHREGDLGGASATGGAQGA